MFTPNVQKKRTEMSISNPWVRMKLSIDATVFKMCHSLILPHGLSWRIVELKPWILLPSVFFFSDFSQKVVLVVTGGITSAETYCKLSNMFNICAFIRLCRVEQLILLLLYHVYVSYVLEFSYLFRTDDFCCSN